MSRTDIEALLDKYLKKETSPAENELVEKWLISPKDVPSEWEEMNDPDRDLWLSDVLAQIDQTIDSKEHKTVKLNPGFKGWKTVISAAAVLIVFLSLFWFSPTIRSVFNPETLISLKVPAGLKKQVILSDGSTVWVNADAEFKYAKVFKGKTREVYLTGEAYFDIKHDAERPFIVHTGKVITTVLGTAFNIKTNTLTDLIDVTVTRGKVSVANDKKVLGLLTPDEKIVVNTSTDTYQRSKTDAAVATGWLQNELRFEDVTFGKAAEQLELQFKVKISFSNIKLKSCLFTGTALKGKDLDQILKVMCAFNNSTYKKQKNGDILISGNGCY